MSSFQNEIGQWNAFQEVQEIDNVENKRRTQLWIPQAKQVKQYK